MRSAWKLCLKGTGHNLKAETKVLYPACYCLLDAGEMAMLGELVFFRKRVPPCPGSHTPNKRALALVQEDWYCKHTSGVFCACTLGRGLAKPSELEP